MLIHLQEKHEYAKVLHMTVNPGCALSKSTLDVLQDHYYAKER